MGITEFAISLHSVEDYNYWMDVIKSHNTSTDYDNIGEELEVGGILKYNSFSKAKNPKVPSGLYLIAINGGGRYLTESFLLKNVKRHSGPLKTIVMGLDNKPRDWMEEKNIVVWTPKCGKDVSTVFEKDAELTAVV